MSTPQGLASYPGIEQIISASITLGHGISPSSARITMAPQLSTIAESGTFTFTIGTTTISFPDCKADQGSYERSDNGEYWHITLLDRRWKWRFGQISGRYNVWRENATLQNGDPPGSAGSGLVADTERTPQQLAALYLDAMGESGYDVSALPNDTRPPVEHDYDNPAEALAELCDNLGCRIVLGLDNTVKIARVGTGQLLPADDLLEDSLTIDPPELPDSVAVVCGPSFFQVDFPLEAVGIDRDKTSGGDPTDTLKPIDELSYKPAGGWSNVDLPLFSDLSSNESEDDVTGLRSLATKSVFRYYRVKVPVRIPGYDGPSGGLVRRLEQILPLFEEQVVTAVENHDSVALPAVVFGVWYPGLDEQANTLPILTVQGNSPPAAGTDSAYKSPFYNRGFTLDTARGLVIFNEPVYRNSTPDEPKVTPAPAQLVLRAKCQVRDTETLALARHIHERSTGGTLGTSPQFILREELVVTHVPTYDPDTYASPLTATNDPRLIDSVATTADDVNDAADHYIDAALEEYTQPEPRQVQIAGLYPLDLDGVIQQITFSVGGAGATTTIARGSEPSFIATSHGERRQSEASRQTVAQVRRSRGNIAGRSTRREAAARRAAR
jgi:hypothetical protein